MAAKSKIRPGAKGRKKELEELAGAASTLLSSLSKQKKAGKAKAAKKAAAKKAPAKKVAAKKAPGAAKKTGPRARRWSQ